MIKIVVGLACATVVLTTSALAVDYRWSQGFGHGTTEALVRNKTGASLNIYCPAGSQDTTPGMFVDTNAFKTKKGTSVDIQIIVDGKNHPFEIKDTQYLAAGRGFRNNLEELVSSIRSSKNKYFTVEYPKYNVVERFSLLNARSSLSSGKKNRYLTTVSEKRPR